MKNLVEYIMLNESTGNKVQPRNSAELQKIIKDSFKKGIYNLNFIDTSKITDMGDLFKFDNNIKHNFDVSDWDVSNVTDMSDMFYECEQFNCDLSKWDVSKVKDMKYMFYGCAEFEGKGLDKWNLSKHADIRYMFDGKNKKIIGKVKLPKWAKERWYNFL